MVDRMNGRIAYCAAALGVLATFGIASAPPVRAQGFTLGAMLDSLQRGAAVVNLVSVDSVANRRLDSAAAALRGAPNVLSLRIATLADVITSRRARLADVNRWDPRATDLLAQAWFRGAILSLASIANGSLADLLEEKAPQQAKGLLAPTDSLGRAVRDKALSQGTERLRRLEIKYGSKSPRLNVVEAGVNYVFQWLPGLRSDADGSPNRHEFIAAYRTLELTATSGSSLPNAQLVSAGQVGLRWYHWAAGWGDGSAVSRLVRPSHASAGLYVMGPQDAALGRLTGVRRRHGVFIGWGDVHVAYLFESPRRVYVGADKQLVPHLF